MWEEHTGFISENYRREDTNYKKIKNEEYKHNKIVRKRHYYEDRKQEIKVVKGTRRDRRNNWQCHKGKKQKKTQRKNEITKLN